MPASPGIEKILPLCALCVSAVNFISMILIGNAKF
jgi:hypothetical protein